MKGGTSRREGEAETYAMRHGRYVRTARSYRFPAVARGGQAHQGADATTNDADEERASRDLAPIASKKAVARGATDPYGEPQGGAKPKSDPGALSNVRSPSRADVELRNAIPRDGDQQRVSTVQVAGGFHATWRPTPSCPTSVPIPAPESVVTRTRRPISTGQVP